MGDSRSRSPAHDSLSLQPKVEILHQLRERVLRERVHVRVAPEVEDRRRSLEPEVLVRASAAGRAVFVVAEEERLRSTVVLQAPPGVGDVGRGMIRIFFHVYW